MINFAVIKYKKSLQVISGINCPDNHNLKKDKDNAGPDLEKHMKENLNIDFILTDYVLPPKGILIASCMKKNRQLGYERRHLMLGHS